MRLRDWLIGHIEEDETGFASRFKDQTLSGEVWRRTRREEAEELMREPISAVGTDTAWSWLDIGDHIGACVIFSTTAEQADARVEAILAGQRLLAAQAPDARDVTIERLTRKLDETDRMLLDSDLDRNAHERAARDRDVKLERLETDMMMVKDLVRAMVDTRWAKP